MGVSRSNKSSPRSRRRDPRLTPIHERPGFDFSITGLIYSSLMMFMGLAAVNTQASLLFGVFGLMIGVLLVAERLSKIVLRRLIVRRLLPDTAYVGRPAVVHYTIGNQKRFWPTFSITISELDAQGFLRQPHAYLLHVANAQSATISCDIIPKRRGRQVFDRFQLATSFPFGFIKRAVTRANHETLLVFPALARVAPDLLRSFRSAENLGQNIRPKLGGMDEFYGLKEYREGESPRMIYWKRTAHSGTVVSRQMTHEAPPRVIVAVDTYAPTDDEAALASVEKSIAQAASLIEAACEAGLAVGFAAHNGEWALVKPRHGKRHRTELLTLLAQLPANSQHDAEHLINEASTLTDAYATIVLFTRGDASSRFAGARGVFTIAADSDETKRWFEFDPNLNFSLMTPLPPKPSTKKTPLKIPGRKQNTP